MMRGHMGHFIENYRFQRDAWSVFSFIWIWLKSDMDKWNHKQSPVHQLILMEYKTNKQKNRISSSLMWLTEDENSENNI